MIGFEEINEMRKFIRDNINKVGIDNIEELYKLVQELIKPKSRKKIDVWGAFKELKGNLISDKEAKVETKVKPKNKTTEEKIIELAKNSGEIWVQGQYFSKQNYISFSENDLGLDFIYIHCKDAYSDYYIKKFEWISKLLRDNGYKGKI